MFFHGRTKGAMDVYVTCICPQTKSITECPVVYDGLNKIIMVAG